MVADATFAPRKSTSGKWPWVIPGVELFHAGIFREGMADDDGNSLEFSCSDDDIHQMVRNFKRFSQGERPTLTPGITVGHHVDDEDNLFSDDSTMANGEVLDVWPEQRDIDGKPTWFIVGDLGVDDETGNGVKDHKLPRVSAEVKETPPDGCDGDGCTLVRVALLGFAPAGAKKLKGTTTPRPNPNYNVRRFGDRVFMFSDLSPTRGLTMDPNDDLGTATIPEEENIDAAMSRDEMIMWLTDNGFDPESLQIDDSTPDDILSDLVVALQALKGGSAVTEPPVEEPEEVVGMSQQFSAMHRDVVRLTREVAALRGEGEALRRNSTVLSRDAQRQAIHTFCDTMVLEGRMSPASAERGGEDFSRLTRAMGDRRVQTFSDAKGRKSKKSILEIEMDAIRQRQPRRFSEIMPGRGAGQEVISPLRQKAKEYFAKLDLSKNTRN